MRFLPCGYAELYVPKCLPILIGRHFALPGREFIAATCNTFYWDQRVAGLSQRGW
jgi:hypothetical protein